MPARARRVAAPTTAWSSWGSFSAVTSTSSGRHGGDHLGDGGDEGLLVPGELGVDEGEPGDVALGQAEDAARGAQLGAAQGGHLDRVAGRGLAPVGGHHQMHGGAGVDLTHDGRSGTERLIVGVGRHHQARPAGRWRR